MTIQQIKNRYHLAHAAVANFWHGFPSRGLIVIGVTGTDGKTTTVNLIHHILKSAGKDSSMISTIGAEVNGKMYDTGFHVTTPSSWKLQKFIKKISAGKTKEPKYLVLEVTSHALDQFRTWGIKFEIGVLTNVTNEHLDYHKTYENYVLTKSKLLRSSTKAILNRDDHSFELIQKNTDILEKALTYGMGKDSDINPYNFACVCPMVGEFNKYNMMAAISVAISLGLTETQIKNGIKTFKAPLGRQEVVHEDGFKVMIDFAHTPNAFSEILPAVKKGIKGKLIHVFGSAGQRDIRKRPEMGKISAEYADIIILTAEDPRSESVEKISKEIEKGIKDASVRESKGRLYKISDRQKAIDYAISIAKKGDLVLLTGKSHEKSMNLGHGEEPWDEYDAVEKAITKL